jgi:GT2 family glycosyltransferase
MKQNSVGVVIATYNRKQELQECLRYVFKLKWPSIYICIVDDGSTDGTWEMLLQEYPDISRIRGDGNLWWAGATNKGIKYCLSKGCEYILLLNTDVQVKAGTILQLVTVSQMNNDAIAASIIVRSDDSNVVWWAGCDKWGPIRWWLPIWCTKHFFKQGTKLNKLPENPYHSSVAHGRGVLISRNVFDTIGYYDEYFLPQYGADIDFSFRATRMGFSILVVPKAKVSLHVDNTSRKVPSVFYNAILGYWRFLTNRKNGEMLCVGWHLVLRYVPFYAVFPTYVFIIALNSFRYWQNYFHQKKMRFMQK